MIVLDAGVLIGHLDGSNAHHDRATELRLAVVDEPLAASRADDRRLLGHP